MEKIKMQYYWTTTAMIASFAQWAVRIPFEPGTNSISEAIIGIILCTLAFWVFFIPFGLICDYVSFRKALKRERKYQEFRDAYLKELN